MGVVGKILGALGALALFAGLIALKFGAGYAVGHGIGYVSQEATFAKETYDLTREGTSAPLFASLEKHYPEEYASLLAKQKEAVHNSDLTQEEINQMAKSEMATLMAKVREDAYRADPQHQISLLNASVETAQAAQRKDASICAEYIGNGITSDIPDNDPLQAVRIQESVRTVEAGANGRNKPQPVLEKMDYPAFGKIIKAAGLSDIDINKFSTLDREKPETQCRLGVALLKAAQALPEGQQLAFLAKDDDSE